jgi:biopolymer transport protein ExbD
MSGHFKKKSANAKQEIPMASMPDIIFMLLIFFMVVTVLREDDLQVRNLLPQAEAVDKIEEKRLVSYVYVGPEKLAGNQLGETAIQIDDAIIEDINAVRNIMYRKVSENQRMIVSMKIDKDSKMSDINEVQQELREAGALRINYAAGRSAGE